MTAAAAGQGPKARPILMSTPMVRALIEGRKTQTRRVVKNPPRLRAAGWSKIEYGPICSQLPRACPYGRPGEFLWVRERFTWSVVEAGTTKRLLDSSPLYYAENEGWDDIKWKPSLHMPRWASRLTLELTGVRVERLNEITESDCWAEGIDEVDGCFDAEVPVMAKRLGCSFEDAKPTFACLWESINGAGSWAANPWVWCLQFEVHHQNVDALIEQRRAA